MNTPIFIVYDSVYNSVFAGQVLSYIKHILNQHKTLGLLITFESTSVTRQDIERLIPDHIRQHLRIIVLKRLPFLGAWTLRYCAHSIATILNEYQTYAFYARGPLAGAIALYARCAACKAITIQARGLLAEEYAYAHQEEQHSIKHLIHTIRKYQYVRLERWVYTHADITIEAVSPALKEYLVNTFNANPAHITRAIHDIPPAIDLAQKQQWRIAVRAQLHIPEHVHVYCYNGSLKSWQCPRETLIFFKERLAHNPDTFLLILTPDVQQAQNLVHTFALQPTTYAIKTVPHTDIYRYVSACDTGILLRAPHIINWVSRPTKLLEYRAVDLQIVHNNTIGYLVYPPDMSTLL